MSLEGDLMKLLRWLDRIVDALAQKLARLYLDNFCSYK